MIQPCSVTLHNIVRWKQAFTILGMERCQPFFEAISLPQAMVVDPKRLGMRARNYVKNVSRYQSAPPVTPDAYVIEVQRALTDTFIQIAVDYDQETADALYVWCLRYIVDDDVAVELSVWRDLFRRLCGLVEKDESSVESPLDSDAMTRICHVVHSHLAPEFMQEIHQRIQTAKALPKSEWEDWLEEDVRQSAGQGEILGAIEMALDLVENIVANFRTFRAWDSVKSQLSPSEEADLFAWATQQARVLGIPSHVIHGPRDGT
jgi:hypothetical protein